MGRVGEVQIQAFHDKPTGTLTYVVYDDESKDAIVIDPRPCRCLRFRARLAHEASIVDHLGTVFKSY